MDSQRYQRLPSAGTADSHRPSPYCLVGLLVLALPPAACLFALHPGLLKDGRATSLAAAPTSSGSRYFSYRLNKDIDSWEVQIDLDPDAFTTTRRASIVEQVWGFLEARDSDRSLSLSWVIPSAGSIASREPSPSGAYNRTIWTHTADPNLEIRLRSWAGDWDEFTAKKRKLPNGFQPWKRSGLVSREPTLLPQGARWSEWAKLENDVHCVNRYGYGGGLSYSSTVINASEVQHLGDRLDGRGVLRFWPEVKEFLMRDATLQFHSQDFGVVSTRVAHVHGVEATVSVTFSYGSYEDQQAEGKFTTVELSMRLFEPMTEAMMSDALHIFQKVRMSRLNGEVSAGCLRDAEVADVPPRRGQFWASADPSAKGVFLN